MAKRDFYTVDDLVSDLQSGKFQRPKEISLRELGIDVLAELQQTPDGPRLVIKKPSGQETIKLTEQDLLSN